MILEYNPVQLINPESQICQMCRKWLGGRSRLGKSETLAVYTERRKQRAFFGHRGIPIRAWKDARHPVYAHPDVPETFSVAAVSIGTD